ncbi:MAG: hypothetical protein JWP91_2077 [Fibrobacteres bacterium]|nr:hypothetical protein [Fibrobacterota bacterium]
MNRKRLFGILAMVSIPLAPPAAAADAGKAGSSTAQTGTAPSGTPSANAPAPSPAAVASATTHSDKIALSRPTASIEIMAEPSKVWKRLISNEGMNAFGVAGDKKRGLEKIGDNLHATIAGDEGNVVVTHVAKDAEWRAAFEPDKGNYICSVRFQLKPQGKNTLLTYADWYSDEKAEMVDRNLKETEKSMAESLARFKGLVEKASAEKQ